MKFTAVGDVLIGRRLNAEDKGLKELAVSAVRSDESVYDKLCEELKNDADVIRERRLWIR